MPDGDFLDEKPVIILRQTPPAYTTTHRGYGINTPQNVPPSGNHCIYPQRAQMTLVAG